MASVSNPVRSPEILQDIAGGDLGMAMGHIKYHYHKIKGNYPIYDKDGIVCLKGLGEHCIYNHACMYMLLVCTQQNGSWQFWNMETQLDDYGIRYVQRYIGIKGCMLTMQHGYLCIHLIHMQSTLGTHMHVLIRYGIHYAQRSKRIQGNGITCDLWPLCSSVQNRTQWIYMHVIWDLLEKTCSQLTTVAVWKYSRTSKLRTHWDEPFCPCREVVYS